MATTNLAITRYRPVMSLLDTTTATVARQIGVISVTGADRLTYLHSLLSQDLEHARPGTVADFLYLDAKGTAVAEGRVVVRAGDVLLVTPQAVTASLADALGRFTFLLEAAAEDLSADWRMTSVRGPDTDDLPGARSQPMTAAPHGDGIVVRDRSGGVDYLGPAAWVTERIGELGLPEAPLHDWERWRIRAAQPAWGREIAAGRRTQELGLLPTHVHLRKGCYPGQESIAKTYNLGRPRRALWVAEFDAAVAENTPVQVGGKAGVITSAAPDGAQMVALALLPLTRDGELPAGDLDAEGVTGHVLHRVGEGLPQPGA
ncbi:folate-binding protein YgfZ [soil metagenome]